MASVLQIPTSDPHPPSAPPTPLPARCAISWIARIDAWLALLRAHARGLAIDTFVSGCRGSAAPLALVDGPQCRVASQAPLAPTEFVFQSLATETSP